MPYPSEHAARMTNPNKYKKFARQNGKFGSGIDAIFGVLPDGKTELQAVRFNEKKFTVAEAKKWLADNKMKPMMFEPAKKETTNNSLAHIVCNLCGMVRNEKLEGKDQIVVPVVMLVEGVLNGSQGPLFYPKEELAKTPVVWNGRPIVVYHPTMNGEACSAGMPEIFNQQKVGVIMNTRYESGALKAEAWLDKDKLTSVDSRILGNIQSAKITEVSTGVFTDNEMTPGEWKGRAYNGIARNYRPDHLAILPDQVGACSVADGAGLLRNQQQSFSDIREAIRSALNPQESKSAPAPVPAVYRCIQDVYPDGTVIYEEGGVYYQTTYEVDEKTGVASLGDTKQEVQEKKEWAPVENVESNQNAASNGGKPVKNKENTMDKKALVDGLIANSDGKYTEEDREKLMNTDETILTKMATPEEKKDEEEASAATSESESQGTTQNAEKKPVTLEEFVTNAPSEIRDVLVEGIRAHAVEKTDLITKITANKACSFSKESLAAKPMAELRAIAALAAPAKPVATTPLFAGMAPVTEVTANASKQEALVSPKWDFKK